VIVKGDPLNSLSFCLTGGFTMELFRVPRLHFAHTQFIAWIVHRIRKEINASEEDLLFIHFSVRTPPLKTTHHQ
jgi:hypothetical protein